MIHAKLPLSSIQYILKKYKVETAYLFGSVTQFNFKDDSDVDILYSFSNAISFEEYANNFFAMADELELLLKRKVDLLAEKNLKNPYLIETINAHKIKIL